MWSSIKQVSQFEGRDLYSRDLKFVFCPAEKDWIQTIAEDLCQIKGLQLESVVIQ